MRVKGDNPLNSGKSKYNYYQRSTVDQKPYQQFKQSINTYLKLIVYVICVICCIFTIK